MGVRGNMWITDSQGSRIEGYCQIEGRENSIEVLSMSHKITSPADMQTGKLNGNRIHTPVTVVKRIDQATPFLNKACCSGECLPEVLIKLYEINDNGEEVDYFSYTLTNARVIAIQPIIGGTEDNYAHDKETIALMYESIRWVHHDGNYSYTDSWTKRA